MPNPVKLTGKKKKGKKHTEKKPSVKWTWGQEQESAFQKLKECLSSPPVLGFSDYSTSKPFELQTDAGISSCGAVLASVRREKSPQLCQQRSQQVREEVSCS